MALAVCRGLGWELARMRLPSRVMAPVDYYGLSASAVRDFLSLYLSFSLFNRLIAVKYPL